MCEFTQDSWKFRCNILISGNIIKEMLGSVASGTHGIMVTLIKFCAFDGLNCNN